MLAMLASLSSLFSMRRPDPHGDLFRHNRWVEDKMVGIAQHELQCVLAGGQIDECLGLAGPEMKMLFVLWDWFVGVVGRIDINQQVMVPAVGKGVAGVRNPHVAETEEAFKGAGHGRI